MTSVNVNELLGELTTSVKSELESMPEVVEKGHDLDVDDLRIVARTWHKLDDAVAVAADMKGSTKLGTGQRAQSTAGIYEASAGSVVKIFNRFEADFITIQGDGAVALFLGERRRERAFCASVTVKTFRKTWWPS